MDLPLSDSSTTVSPSATLPQSISASGSYRRLNLALSEGLSA